MPINILHVISSEGFYGAESVVSALCLGLQKVGHKAHVAIFDNGHRERNNAVEEFRRRVPNVTRVPCQGRIDRKAIRQIRELILQNDVQILHTHGYKADIYGYLAARGLTLPKVATCHLWTRRTRSIRAYELLDSLFLRRFEAVVGVSDDITHEARISGVAANKSVTIDNGIDLSRFRLAPAVLRDSASQDRLVIGTVGRLVSQKGITYFLQAARRILSEFPNVMFVLVGDGPDRPQLERLAQELGISSHVCFAGVHSDMPGVYASLDIFVLASVDEGMPMVILEALASRLPVVATKVGAVHKLIFPGRTGLLVQPRDVKELTDAIRAIIRDPDLGRRLGRNGESLVRDQFCFERMTGQYCHLYKRLLQEASIVRG